MSLLGSQVYANPTTPLWASTGTITTTGPLTVNGTLDVNGNADFDGTVNLDGPLTANQNVRLAGPVVNVEGLLSIQGPNVKVAFQETGVGTGLSIQSDPIQVNGFVETNGSLYLGKILASTTANTVFTPSVPTANTDLLSVGGRILSAAGGGITPLVSAVANTVIPIGGFPTTLVPSPALPTLPNTWYDVQLTGLWDTPVTFTPAPGDFAQVTVSLDPGLGIPAYWSWTMQEDQDIGIVWPQGGYSPVNLRARLKSGPTGLANLTITAFVVGAGTYSGNPSFEVLAVSLVRLS